MREVISLNTLPKAKCNSLLENSKSSRNVTLQASADRALNSQSPDKCLNGPSTNSSRTWFGSNNVFFVVNAWRMPALLIDNSATISCADSLITRDASQLGTNSG